MCADCSVCEGSFPSPVECIIIVWVFGLLWKEMKEVYEVGIFCYLSDLWSLAGKPQLFSSFLIFPSISEAFLSWVMWQDNKIDGTKS